MIEVERIESGIYVYRWIGHVDMQDAKRSMETIFSLTEGKPYVAIIDMGKIDHLPNDIAQMRVNIKAEVQQGLCGYVVFDAPRFVLPFLKTLAVLAPTTYQFSYRWDEALRMARTLLETVGGF